MGKWLQSFPTMLIEKMHVQPLEQRYSQLTLSLVPVSNLPLPSTSFLHSRARERVTSNANFIMPPCHTKPFSGSSCFNIKPKQTPYINIQNPQWVDPYFTASHYFLSFPVLQSIVTLNHYNFPTNSFLSDLCDFVHVLIFPPHVTLLGKLLFIFQGSTQIGTFRNPFLLNF